MPMTIDFNNEEVNKVTFMLCVVQPVNRKGERVHKTAVVKDISQTFQTVLITKIENWIIVLEPMHGLL